MPVPYSFFLYFYNKDYYFAHRLKATLDAGCDPDTANSEGLSAKLLLPRPLHTLIVTLHFYLWRTN